MKINKSEVLASFSGYDDRTIDMLEIILKEVKKQGKELSEYSLVIFQLLAIQFEIFYKAYDAIGTDIVNVCQIGERTVHAPKPQLDALQKANLQIRNMLKDLGLSPLEQVKIKKLKSAEENDNASGENILANTLGVNI